MFAVDSLRMMLVKCFVVCLIHFTSLSGPVRGTACVRPVVHGLTRIKSFDETQLVEFECRRDDFVMYGLPVLKCLNGIWGGAPPLCRNKRSCLLEIEHGSINKSAESRRTHGPWSRNDGQGSLACDDGYMSADGNVIHTCKMGNWEPTPLCGERAQLGKCVIPSLANGKVSQSHTRILPGVVATHSCDEGYTMSGPVKRTCQHGGSWDGEEVKCDFTPTCDAPPEIVKARKPENRTYINNERYRYSCNRFYEQRGGGSLYRCDGVNKKWVPLGNDTRLMTCERVSCGRPRQIPNTVVTLEAGNTFIGSRAIYRCDVGYKKTWGILSSIVCQPNKKWTVISMRCDVIDCGDPGPMYNGYLGPGGTIYGEQRSFRCNARTTMEPEINDPHRTILCLNTSQWSRPLPTCWGKCLVPRFVDHGYHTRSGVLIEHEEETTISCDRRYTTDIRNPTERSKTRQCWNGTLTIASCTEKPCTKLSESSEGLKNAQYTPADAEIDGTDLLGSKYYTHGTEVRTTCKDTHETRPGNRVISSQFSCDKGEWSGKSSPICLQRL